MIRIISISTVLGFLALCVFVNSKAVPDDPSLGIIAGREAAPHSAPYIVMLRTTRRNATTGKIFFKVCGGTIINNLHVLTAKQCVRKGIKTTLYFGKHNLDLKEEGQVIQTSSHYILNEKADLALIRLAKKLTFNGNITSISYPADNDKTNYVGKNAIARGWGLTSDDGERPNVLMELVAPVISLKQCNQELKPFNKEAKINEICTTGRGNRGTCQEDTGGPLVVSDKKKKSNVLIGVISWRPRQCAAGGASVYVSTQVYSKWIRQNSS